MSLPGPPETDTLRWRRLELDNDDLRLENARLKASIAEKQDEIIRLGERLGRQELRLHKLDKAVTLTGLRRIKPLWAILRRLA